MLYIIGLLVCLFAGFYPKSKRITVLIFVYLLFIGVFAPDKDGYKLLYLNPKDYSCEYGFKFLISICKAIHLSYYVFKTIYVSAILVLLIKGIQFFTEKANIVLALYIIYPFWIDMIELRSALGMSLVLFGLRYLFKGNNKVKSLGLYSLFVILAASLHQSMYVYLVLILILYLDNKKCLIATAVGFGVFYALNSPILLPVIDFISRFVSVSAMKTYILTQYHIYSSLHLVFWIMLRIVPVVFFRILVKQKRTEYVLEINKNEYTLDNFEFFYKASMLLIMFLPFEFRKIEFERIYRLVFIYIYIGISSRYTISCNSLCKIKKRTLLITLIFIIYMGCAMYYFFISNTSESVPYFYSVFRPVFENNVLLN